MQTKSMTVMLVFGTNDPDIAMIDKLSNDRRDFLSNTLVFTPDKLLTLLTGKPFRVYMLTLKAPNKIAADDILIFYFYLSKKIRLDQFSCESSA